MTSHSFNVSADKVVNVAEWKLKSRAILNKEFSAREKLATYLIDTPVSTVIGVGLVIKGVFNKKSRAGISVDTQRKSAFGLYTTGAKASDMMGAVEHYIFSKKRKEKIYALSQRGFEQCEDARSKPVIQRLKPL